VVRWAAAGTCPLQGPPPAQVSYLSLKTWLDSRQEKEDQEAAAKGAEVGGPAAPAGAAGGKRNLDDEAALLSLRKSTRVRGAAKGFGASTSSVAKNTREF
jgi:hypothetical protein